MATGPRVVWEDDRLIPGIPLASNKLISTAPVLPCPLAVMARPPPGGAPVGTSYQLPGTRSSLFGHALLPFSLRVLLPLLATRSFPFRPRASFLFPLRVLLPLSASAPSLFSRALLPFLVMRSFPFGRVSPLPATRSFPFPGSFILALLASVV